MFKESGLGSGPVEVVVTCNEQLECSAVKPVIATDQTKMALEREQERQRYLESERQRNIALRRNLTVNSGTDYGGKVIVLDQGRPEYRNCVATVRMFHPYPQGGCARCTPQWINSQEPAVGAVAVQSTHVMIVVSFTDTTVTIKEGNFWSGYLTQRTIPRSTIKGYYL